MSSTTSASPLDGIRAKLDRVSDLISALEQQLKEAAESGRYTVPGQYHRASRNFSFVAYGPPLPLASSVRAGEIVHHLRSVLDHLVWQLVIANGGAPTERNEFPVCDSPARFEEAIKRRKLQGVSAPAAARIESLQPYHAATVETSWLWVVHELDRIDKHRLLVVLLAAMRLGQRIVMRRSSGDVKISGMTPPKWTTITPGGAEVFRIELAEPCPDDVCFEAQFEMSACIDRVGSVEMPQLTSTLRGAFAGVQAAIASFEEDFR